MDKKTDRSKVTDPFFTVKQEIKIQSSVDSYSSKYPV